ncbi:MAG: M3 family metallopeptidase, partial [Okeania sp. SIO2D1]|nr:M3 family metallopeptidase [Okeania sp. SIO2D1]
MNAQATVTNKALLNGKGLPSFESIKPEDVVPTMTELLTELEQELTNLEATVKPTWNELVEPLQKLVDRLSWSWGIVGHLMGVKNSPELRKAYNEVQPKVVEFSNKLNQSQPLYQAFKKLHNSDSWQNLDSGQKRIVEAAIRDAELSGVGLEGEQRERFNTIQQELAELSTKFSNNVLDATKAFSLTLTNKEEVDGLPPSLLSLAAQGARDAGAENATPESGPWRITLDYPSFAPFMQHSKRRELREKLYKAFISRASSGELNNYPLIQRILELRQQKTQILGFNSYAELSLASKMAPGVEAVEKLLEELRSVSYDAAVTDLEELKKFAASKNAPEANDLKHWDTSFWAERLREEKFAFTAEELRPYFPLPQ